MYIYIYIYIYIHIHTYIYIYTHICMFQSGKLTTAPGRFDVSKGMLK